MNNDEAVTAQTLPVQPTLRTTKAYVKLFAKDLLSLKRVDRDIVGVPKGNNV